MQAAIEQCAGFVGLAASHQRDEQRVFHDLARRTAAADAHHLGSDRLQDAHADGVSPEAAASLARADAEPYRVFRCGVEEAASPAEQACYFRLSMAAAMRSQPLSKMSSEVAIDRRK